MAPLKRWSMGVLNDSETDAVPGTVMFFSRSHQEPVDDPKEEGVGVAQLALQFPEAVDEKRTPDHKFILSPQPDDNPNDPLNWPSWRRNLAFLCLGWQCLLGGGQVPVLAAGFQDFADGTEVDFKRVALTTGILMLGLGLSTAVTGPLAIIYGKRPTYLGGVVIFLVASIWCSLAKSYSHLIFARMLMGFGIGPCESLPGATITEIFFLHERAYKVGIYTMLLLGGKNLASLVGAVIINSIGWRTVAIVVGVNFLLVFFFVPETFWDRALSRPGRDMLPRRAPRLFSKKGGGKKRARIDAEVEEGNNIAIPEPEKSFILSSHDKAPFQSQADCDSEKQNPRYDTRSRKAASFISSLKIWNGRLRPDPFLRALRRPVVLLVYPAICWSTVVYSLSVGWLIVLSESLAHIFQRHPYNFSRVGVGVVYLSPLAGGILGTAVAGKVSDLLVRFMARRNRGIYEPEFRLVMCIPLALCTTVGLIGFGWFAENDDRWAVPTLFLGLISFGCSLASSTAITFAIDSHQEFAGEALVTLNVSKSVLNGLVFSQFVHEWLKLHGSKVFMILGGIQLGCLLFTVPLYVYGKRLRMWAVRKDFWERWG